MFGLGTIEIIAVVVVLLILFGPKLLPKVTKNIADTIRETLAIFGSKGKKKD